MRSHHPRWLWRLWALGLLTLAVTSVPGVALAQLTINPTATPVRNTGGWVYWMAEGAIILSGIVVILAGGAYLRFAPRFSRSAREQQAKDGPMPAPPASAVRIQYTPPPAPVAEPVPAAVGTPAAPAAQPEAPAAAPAPTAA